jgi:DNA-binding NarL/FixJ family response regulator
MAKLQVLLADDHAVVRAGLKALIEAEEDMAVVGEAANGREALQLAQDCVPDIVVMDVSMPELSGVAATDQIRQACPATRVLALSFHEETSYLRSLLKAGASGYVLKRSAAETLVHAIRTVAGGAVYLDPALADRLVDVVTHSIVQPTPVSLSERESEVLRMIALGYSNKEIASQLGVSVKTVETYKARAMQKLGMASRVDIVRYATRLGWL